MKDDAMNAKQEPSAPGAEDLVGSMLGLLSEGATLGSMLGYSEQSQEALYALGYANYNQGRYDDALKMFGFLLMHNHRERRFYKAFGACLQMQKRHEEALKYYGIASMMDLTDPEPVFHCAQCLLALARVEEAKEALEYARGAASGEERHAEIAARVDAILDLLARQQGKD